MAVAAADAGSPRAPSTSFVGRRDELGRLRSLMAASRLLTIVGPGGSGKTRLAEELVGQLARSLGSGFGFAFLADVDNAADVGAVVAAAVGLRGGGEPRAALVEYLRDRRYLLVLDNCEHVHAGAAAIASAIIESCPKVTVLATSRRPLLVPGEQLFPLDGLSEEAAIRLFADRVRLASPSFVLEEAQRPLVAGLCARLDAMPLAIELAAARLRRLGLGDLIERLSGHLADLGSTESVAPDRQATLRGAIDWSHDLLDEAPRILWRRLAVFVGGFTLRAAEIVAAIPPLPEGSVERLLGELVDRSMVAFDLSRDRYRLIEVMREYGLERLREADEETAIAERHRAWMLERAEDLDRRWWGADQERALDAISSEAANLRAALESCRSAGAGEQGLRIATASLWYWMTRASHDEAHRWFMPFLESSRNAALAARAHAAAAWIAVLSGRLADARRYIDRAGQFASRAADARVNGFIQTVDGYLLITEELSGEATAVAGAAVADPDVDPLSRSWALVDIGCAALLLGNWEEAARVGRQGMEACRAVGESWSQVPHLHVLAVAAWQRGDPDRASSLLRDALYIDRRLDDIWHRAWSIEILAWVTRDAPRAARLLGVAASCRELTGSSMPGPLRRFHDAAEAELRRRLGPAKLAREIDAGRQLDAVSALAFALEEERRAPGPSVRAHAVSARELEVAALVAQGCANREIARRLFLSPRTVDTHVEHLMDKLGVGSRAEVAAWHAREVGSDPADVDPAESATIPSRGRSART